MGISMLRYALARIHPVDNHVEYLQGCFYWSGWSEDLEKAKQCETPKALKAYLTKNRDRLAYTYNSHTRLNVPDVNWEFRLVEIESVMTCDITKGTKL